MSSLKKEEEEEEGNMIDLVVYWEILSNDFNLLKLSNNSLLY